MDWQEHACFVVKLVETNVRKAFFQLRESGDHNRKVYAWKPTGHRIRTTDPETQRTFRWLVSFPCGKTLGIGATKVRFSSTLVRSFCLDYTATRLGTVCNSCTPTYESGLISGIYDGTNWDFTHDFLGCAGLDFNIDSSGQIYYFTDSQKGQGTIKLKATTIAQ